MIFFWFQVRSERNQLSKTLAEANDEINELKHKLKIKSYQVQQLKEDIQTKDNLLVKEEFSEFFLEYNRHPLWSVSYYNA